MACDPAMEAGEQYHMPRSLSGIKPLNSNYKNKSSKILRWRQMRKELAEQG